MVLKTFGDYFNTVKRDIQIICSSINATSDYRTEYQDLYQEATLKLLEIYKNGKPLDVNYVGKSIKNHLLKYAIKNSRDAIGFNLNNLLY